MYDRCTVYVLTAQRSNEDVQVFSFRHLQDARLKVYDFFGEEDPFTKERNIHSNPKTQAPVWLNSQQIQELKSRPFESVRGTFDIHTQTIQMERTQ